MDSYDEALNVLIGMRQYEMKLFEIYGSFSNIFNEHKNFWHEISIEENTHAFMVETFISLYKNGDISFSDRTFHNSQINNDINKLIFFQKDIEKRKIDIKKAVEFALSAESSIIERDLFKLKDNDPSEFKKILKVLHEDSKRHYFKIKEFHQNIMEKEDEGLNS